MNESARQTDLSILHPAMRAAALEVLRQSESESLEFRVFEAYRTPERQTWLYQQGRTVPNTSIVTRARAWESYHQYGLAVDFVLFVNDAWSWETKGELGERWKRLQEIGKTLALEGLSFELPHLQVAGLKLADLRVGKLPAGGDDAWQTNLGRYHKSV
jgi:peptidoglycan LD-endopeptidase CwlK